MRRILTLIFLLGCSFSLRAQIRPDTAVSLDENFEEHEFESLVEQSAGEENFFFLDFLDTTTTNTPFRLRSRFTRRLQQSKGYDEQKYLGSPFRVYHRMTLFEGRDFSAGILMEKDAGEQRLNDFTSGYLTLRSLGPITTAVLGDYYVEAGQGITFWRGYEMQKGANIAAPVSRKERGVRPYTSSDENYFLRGGAVNLQFHPLSLQLFYSKRKLSATIDTSLGGGAVTSFYTTGYFRTETEVSKRDQVEEQLIGGHLSYLLSEQNRIGVTGYATKFSRLLVLQGGKRFTNDRLSMISADYQFYVSGVRLFGEWARGDNQSIGGISGIQITPTSTMNFITVYRNYPYDFVSFHGNAFGERTGTYNEKGFYSGVRVRPLPKVLCSAYYDQFVFLMPSSTSKFSSGGHEIFLQAEAVVVPRFDFFIRYRRKITDQQETIIEGMTTKRIDDQLTKHGVRFHADYQVSKNVKLRGRVEVVDLMTKYTKRRERGFLVYQDVRLQQSERWLLNFRIVLFHTDSYDAGVAEYESDLPGVLSVPILYGKGAKWYLLVKYNVFETLDLSLKYSDLIRDDVKRIGSGLDEIPTNHDNRIGAQLDFRF